MNEDFIPDSALNFLMAEHFVMNDDFIPVSVRNFLDQQFALRLVDSSLVGFCAFSPPARGAAPEAH